METTSVQLSKVIKKLNRASLEYVLFETLLREAAEQGETPTLERVNRILAMQEQEGGDASSSTEASTPALFAPGKNEPPAPGTSSPGKNEPPAPTATPGKDKATWDELSSAERAAATEIGYNQLGWDEGIPPETCSKRWATLTADESASASLLGYSGAEWDAELEEEESAAGGEPHADTAASADEGEPNGVHRAEEIPAPSAAAPAPAPSASDVTLGKDKATWEELSPRERAAATAIGYNQLGWNEGIPPETCSKRWATLADAERTAASLLGYSGAEWDAELEEEQGAGSGGAAEVAASQGPDALADLGQETSSMSLGMPAAPSTPAAPAAPARASSAPAPTKAAGHGGAEPARASLAPAVLGKDKEEWASLTAEEQRAAAALGFERGMWDEGVAPEKCSLPWAAPS